MKNKLTYYVIATLPIVCLLYYFNTYAVPHYSSVLVIAGIYYFYKKTIDFIRMKALLHLPWKDLWKFFIPFYNYKYYKYLY